MGHGTVRVPVAILDGRRQRDQVCRSHLCCRRTVLHRVAGVVVNNRTVLRNRDIARVLVNADLEDKQIARRDVALDIAGAVNTQKNRIGRQRVNKSAVDIGRAHAERIGHRILVFEPIRLVVLETVGAKVLVKQDREVHRAGAVGDIRIVRRQRRHSCQIARDVRCVVIPDDIVANTRGLSIRLVDAELSNIELTRFTMNQRQVVQPVGEPFDAHTCVEPGNKCLSSAGNRDGNRRVCATNGGDSRCSVPHRFFNRRRQITRTKDLNFDNIDFGAGKSGLLVNIIGKFLTFLWSAACIRQKIGRNRHRRRVVALRLDDIKKGGIHVNRVCTRQQIDIVGVIGLILGQTARLSRDVIGIGARDIVEEKPFAGVDHLV
ncbi:hypothetical protein BOA8489_01725 [Boseongicola aestuarii]|uniref:Uncharacterized protein n=1 Tax=Boseongicola aestuarii TaxID=1470561 RepID=A0A238J0B6_9RHOB|nr:hypothetical protein BOA8489_01725 [Boseongicola aestuarii]